MNLFLAILLIYSFLLIGIGLRLSRSISSSLDFYVASRELGPGLIFSTLLAANIGAGSTVGAAGLGYRLGLSGWWWVGSAAVGSVLLAFVVGPRIWSLAKRNGFLTAGDFLEFRYNADSRILSSLLLWLATLTILAGQLIAFSRILEVVAGISKPFGCLLGGVVLIVYFTGGGLKGTAWINLVQLTIKITGFSLALPLILFRLGGWTGLRQRILEQGIHGESYFSISGIGWEEILAYLILLGPAFIVSPGILQKVYGAQNKRVVRLGVGTNAAVLFLYSFFPVLLGMCVAASFPRLENPELALPLVITEMLPLWLGAFLLIGVFSAEISSADAALFMLSTSLGRDFFQTYIRSDLDDQQLLRISRLIAVGVGTLGIGLAIALPSVISALTIFYSFISVTFFAPIILGLFSHSKGGSCVAATTVAVLTTSILHLLTNGNGIWIFSPTTSGVIVSTLILSWTLRR